MFQQSNHVLNFVIYFLLTCGLSISLGFFFRILFLRGLFILATKKGKKISELILPHRFSVKVAWEHLRRHRQMVEWHDIVWFKNVVPRHSFLLWMAVQQKLTTQDRLYQFGIHGPNRCSLCLRNNEDHNHLFFECAYTKAI